MPQGLQLEPVQIDLGGRIGPRHIGEIGHVREVDLVRFGDHEPSLRPSGHEHNQRRR